MLLIDRLLASPITATLWVARQLQQTIAQQQAEEPARLAGQLRELYMMLETGQIAETEFNAREKELLDQLDRLEEAEAGPHENEPNPAPAPPLMSHRAQPLDRK